MERVSWEDELKGFRGLVRRDALIGWVNRVGKQSGLIGRVERVNWKGTLKG